MENYSKMSELASTELKDVQTVKILICYLLYRINKPVDSEQLYDIAVTTEKFYSTGRQGDRSGTS